MQKLVKVLDPDKLQIINVLTKLNLKSGEGMKRVIFSKQILVSLRVTVSVQTSLHFILKKHGAARNMATMIAAAP